MTTAPGTTELGLAEDSIIGAILLTGGRILDDLTLTPADFWSTRAATCYDLATTLHRAGKPADLVTITDAAKQDPATARAIDTAWLMECTDRTPTAASATYYADIVHTEALRRRMRTAAQKIHQLADETPNPNDAIDTARATLDAITTHTAASLETFGDIIDQTIDTLTDPPTNAPTPWTSLNRIIDGFQPGRLYIVGARPGVGKSVFALQAALQLCGHGPIAYSSLEMSARELTIRAFAYDCKIDIARLMRHNLGDNDWAKISDRRGVFDNMPLYIDDTAGRTITDIRTHVRNVTRRGELAGIVVDYLQLISGDRGTQDGRYEITTEVSRQLKLMAKEFRVPVIALSQLNRGSSQRVDKRPAITDLRESGAIEQDADVVILLHRSEVPEEAHEMQMIVAKNRHGPQGVAEFDFYGHYSEIREKSRYPVAGVGYGNPFADRQGG